MLKQKEQQLVYAFVATYLLLCIYISLHFEGTAGTGDTTMHYLFSRWAFKHPENFLDHWGKPLFTLFSSPFAYFGFSGMKIFNSLVASLVLLFTYLSARELKLKYAWLAPLLLAFSPEYFRLIFSGLTEHFFALVFVVGLYLSFKERFNFSSVVISFLPFARSEGLIILGVFAVYFLVRKKYKALFLLLTGHVVYGLVGLLFFYHDFLWVFTKIPYAHLSSVYGKGPLLHFVQRLNYVIGPVFYILLIISVILKTGSFFKSSWRNERFVEFLLPVFASFLGFFVAHSLFWYLGIFNSMGLQRVLIDALPAAALMALWGINRLDAMLPEKGTVKKIVLSILVILLIQVPIVKTPYSLHFDRDFYLDDEQKLVHEVAAFIKKNYNDYKYLYQPSYVSIALDIDHFDSNKRQGIFMSRYPEGYKDKTLVVWDSYFALFDGITLERLRSWKHLEEIKTFTMPSNPNRKYIIFRYLPEVGLREEIKLVKE